MTTQELLTAMIATMVYCRVNQKPFKALWILASNLGLPAAELEVLVNTQYRPLTAEDYETHREGLHG